MEAPTGPSPLNDLFRDGFEGGRNQKTGKISVDLMKQRLLGRGQSFIRANCRVVLITKPWWSPWGEDLPSEVTQITCGHERKEGGGGGGNRWRRRRRKRKRISSSKSRIGPPKPSLMETFTSTRGPILFWEEEEKKEQKDLLLLFKRSLEI